jgi:hypothetical protein
MGRTRLSCRYLVAVERTCIDNFRYEASAIRLSWRTPSGNTNGTYSKTRQIPAANLKQKKASHSLLFSPS